MAQQTDTQLQALADQIKNEAVPAANTATRVGGLFGDFVDSKLNIQNIDTNTSLGTSNSVVPSQNAVRTYVTNTASTLNASISNVALTVSNMSYAGVYAAILTQDGTPNRPPSATIIKNTLRFTPTWGILFPGQYYISDYFDYRYTTFTIGGSTTCPDNGQIRVFSNMANGNNMRIYINTISDITAGSTDDGLLFNTPIEIHVYQ